MWPRISRHPRWVKLGTLLKTSERKQKEETLATARVQKENQKNQRQMKTWSPQTYKKRPWRQT